MCYLSCSNFMNLNRLIIPETERVRRKGIFSDTLAPYAKTFCSKKNASEYLTIHRIKDVFEPCSLRLINIEI